MHIFINLLKKKTLKNFKFTCIMKYLSHIVFLMYKWYKFMRNISIFEHIPIEKKWYRSECFRKMKYHQTTALYSEKLIRIKRSINGQTILKQKKKNPWNFCNKCDMFQRFYFDREQFNISLYTTFLWLFDLNLKNRFF